MTCGAMALGLALGGCGGGGSSPSSSVASTSSSTTSSSTTQTSTSAGALPSHPQLHRTDGIPLSTTVAVGSPAAAGGGQLPSRYTCDGGDISLPVSWSKLPPRTKEVVLFLITARNVEGNLGLKALDWAVANLNPSTGGIPGGRLPAGAIVGANTDGDTHYSICPPKGNAGSFAVLLYALPSRLAVKQGFNASLVRERAANAALAGGVFVVNYKRR